MAENAYAGGAAVGGVRHGSPRSRARRAPTLADFCSRSWVSRRRSWSGASTSRSSRYRCEVSAALHGQPGALSGVIVLVLGAVLLATSADGAASLLSTFDLRAAPWQIAGTAGCSRTWATRPASSWASTASTAGAAALLIASSPAVDGGGIGHVAGIDRLRRPGVGRPRHEPGPASRSLVVVGRDTPVEAETLGVVADAGRGRLAWGLYTTVVASSARRRRLADGLCSCGVARLDRSARARAARRARPGRHRLGGHRLARGPGRPVYSGGLSIGLAYVLWNQSVRAVGPSRTAAFSNLGPVVIRVC